MKRIESNWERDIREGIILSRIFIVVLLLFSVTVMGVLVKDATDKGVLQEFLVSTFLGCVSASIVIFTSVFTVVALVKSHKNHAGVVETFFYTLAVRIYSSIRKISGVYTHKKLSFFLNDLFKKYYMYLGLENSNDLKLCKDKKPRYIIKNGHLFYRISFHVPLNFKPSPKLENRIRSIIIQDLRRHGVDGLFSYYDDTNHNRLDSIQLFHMFWDEESSVVSFEILFVSSEYDAQYVLQRRNAELQKCN